MSVKVFVVAHKECDIPQVEGYYSLLVGAQNKKIAQSFDYYDNDGVNISTKNNNYCELTGLYWMWKNVDADIVGLCHYRRFFSRAVFSISSKYYLNERDIERLMRDYDVLLPKRVIYLTSIEKSAKTAPNKKDLEEMRTAIEVISPEYLDEYNRFLNQRSAYMFNMCIMKKELLNEYSKWIFEILTYIEEHHDMSVEKGYRERLFGFLSERLIYVWVKYNIKPERIKEVRVVRTDVGIWTQILKEIKNSIKKVIFYFSKTI